MRKVTFHVRSAATQLLNESGKQKGLVARHAANHSPRMGTRYSLNAQLIPRNVFMLSKFKVKI